MQPRVNFAKSATGSTFPTQNLMALKVKCFDKAKLTKIMIFLTKSNMILDLIKQ